MKKKNRMSFEELQSLVKEGVVHLKCDTGFYDSELKSIYVTEVISRTNIVAFNNNTHEQVSLSTFHLSEYPSKTQPSPEAQP